MNEKRGHSDKPDEGVQEPEGDQDRKRWEERLKRIARAKPDADAPPHDPVVRKKPQEKG